MEPHGPLLDWKSRLLGGEGGIGMDLLTPVHLVIILVIALLLFGPKRLPEIGAGIGKTIKEFRKSMNEVQQDLAVEAKQEPPAEPKA